MLFSLFATFFKIGCFTFGGGYAMIPLIEKDVVDKQKWLTQEEFIEMLAVVQSLPGPISVNSSVFIGYKVGKLPGAILSVLGIAIPSFIIILLIAMAFSNFSNNPTIVKIFKGVRPAVVALIAAPIVNMYKLAGVTWRNLWIPLIATILIGFLGVSPIWIIIGVAILSIAINLWLPDFQNKK